MPIQKNISKIHYEEIDDSVYNMEEACKFYYIDNMMGMSDEYMDQYMEYVKRDLNIRNKLLKEMSDQYGISVSTNKSIIFGLSSIKNKVVLIANA